MWDAEILFEVCPVLTTLKAHAYHCAIAWARAFTIIEIALNVVTYTIIKKVLCILNRVT